MSNAWICVKISAAIRKFFWATSTVVREQGLFSSVKSSALSCVLFECRVLHSAAVGVVRFVCKCRYACGSWQGLRSKCCYARVRVELIRQWQCGGNRSEARGMLRLRDCADTTTAVDAFTLEVLSCHLAISKNVICSLSLARSWGMCEASLRSNRRAVSAIRTATT